MCGTRYTGLTFRVCYLGFLCVYDEYLANHDDRKKFGLKVPCTVAEPHESNICYLLACISKIGLPKSFVCTYLCCCVDQGLAQKHKNLCFLNFPNNCTLWHN